MARPGFMRVVVACCLAGTLAGCAEAAPAAASRACPPGQGVPLLAYQLFFGRGMGAHGEVSETTWNDFVSQVITPNLPNGYTIFDGVGHWRDPGTGRSVQERTKVLLAAVPDTEANAAAVARIRQTYATRIQQSLVGLEATPVCGDF